MSKKFFLVGALVCLILTNLALGQTDRPTMGFSGTPVSTLSSEEITAKLSEAKRLLQSQVGAATGSGSVALAALNPATSEIQVISVAKDLFLTKGATLSTSTNSGNAVRLQIIRPNGVNTAVTVTDANGRSLLPLLVQYPIERDGSFRENAYYTSAHPALVSASIVAEGQRYLDSAFAQANNELQSSGVEIPSDIVEVAKHLVIVEHTDHKRFREEDHAQIYPRSPGAVRAQSGRHISLFG